MSHGKAPDAESIPPSVRRSPDIYVFDLAPVRNRLNDSWDRYGPSTHRIAHRLLFRSLNGKGSFQRYGDAYAISFHRLRGKQAAQAGERIYAEFQKLLASGKGTELLSERTARHKAGAATTHEQPNFFRRLKRRLRSIFRRGNAEKTDTVDSGLDDIAAPEFPEDEGERTDEVEPAGTEPDASPPAARPHHGSSVKPRPTSAKRVRGKPMPPPVPSANGDAPRRSKDHNDARKLLAEARTLEDAIARTVLRRHGEWSMEKANRGFPPPDLGFIYRPMWNLRSRHLTTYTSVPVCWKNSMEVVHGADIVPPPRRPENLFELDIRCLADTMESVERLMVQKQSVLFMSVVHASTLAHEATEKQFLTALRAIPEKACRQIIFEIADIAQYAHSTEAARMVRRLQPFCRAVTASTGLQDRSFAFWKQCGIIAVGADVSRDSRAEADLVRDLPAFVSQARRHSLLTYLRELNRYSVTISAAAAGFDFLEGALIGSCETPEDLALAKFDVEDLYLRRVEDF